MTIYVLIDNNFIVKSWGKPLSEEHIPIKNSVVVETDLDLDEVQIIDNYMLIDSKLVELTEEEKPRIEEPTDKMEVLERENRQLWDTVEMLLKANGFLSSEDPIYQIKE